MSIYKCNRCPYTTASHFLLKEHEFSTHVQNIKIDPNSPRAPTSVSFGPDVVKAPTSIHVSHSEAVQHGYGVDDVDMNSDTESDAEDENEKDTEDESESDTEDQDLLEIINDIKSTFNYSLQLRKKFREKIEDMEEYEQEEWKKILKSYAKLEASVKDEIEGLDSVDKGEEEEEDKEEGDDEEDEGEEGEDEGKDDQTEKEDFWDFIKEFKHVLNGKDLKMVEKYFDKEAEKTEESKNVEDDEGIEDGKMVIEKVDELKDDFDKHGSDCFKHCSKEKIHCLATAVNSLLRSGSTVMNRQKAKFIRELMMPYHETVRKIANPKVSTHEKRKLLQKAQVGEGVLNSVTKYLS